MTLLKRRELTPGLKGACLAILLGGGLAPRLPAQATDSLIAWSRLSRLPRAADSAWPRIPYPEPLRSADIAGQVQVDLFIDSAGQADWSRSRVVHGAHDLFTSAVREAVARWTFGPAELDTRPVATMAPLTVTFTLPVEHDAPVQELAASAIDSAGIRILLGWETIPRDSSVAPDSLDHMSARSIVLRELLAVAESIDSLAAVCVGWDVESPRRPVPPAVLRRLRLYFPDVRTFDRCPPTHGSRVTSPRLDARGRRTDRRPRGAVDPVWVEVGSVQPWTASRYVMAGSVRQGTATHHYFCEALRDERGRWSASCELRSTTIT